MSQQINLTRLQSQFRKFEKEQGSANGIQQFVIVPERGDKQILQMNLTPTAILYFRGQKIYSNSASINIGRGQGMNGFLGRILNKRKELNMVMNDTSGVQILGVKHQTKSGQILILDLSVYKRSFYVNEEMLLASKKPIGLKDAKHPQLPFLQLTQYRNKLENIFDALDITQQTLVLQSDSVIMEKYLGEGQQFCLFNSSGVVAVSQEVHIQLFKDNHVQGVKFRGSGWVFYETNRSLLIGQIRGAAYARLVVFLVSIFLFPVLIEMVEGIL